jgi:hypothetical protein
MVAILFITIFRRYSHGDDPLEIACYALGCGLSTWLVLTLMPGRSTQKKKPPKAL